MNIDKFWALIDQARNQADGWEEMDAPLVDSLAALEMSDLMMWAQIFSEYQRLSYKNKLWAAAYIINGGCSDDGFDYFRAWLTAQGRQVFLEALADPDSLAEVSDCEGDVEYEDLLGVASHAYFKKIGLQGRDYDQYAKELDQYPLPEEVAADMRAEIEYASDIDVEWDEDEGLEELLPKLCEAFDW